MQATLTEYPTGPHDVLRRYGVATAVILQCVRHICVCLRFLPFSRVYLPLTNYVVLVLRHVGTSIDIIKVIII